MLSDIQGVSDEEAKETKAECGEAFMKRPTSVHRPKQSKSLGRKTPPQRPRIKPRNERTLEYALKYAGLGWSALPLHSVDGNGKCSCGKADCGSPGKHPDGKLAPKGLKNATKDKKVIEGWFAARENLNVGICTGSESGIVVLDNDPRHGGEESLAEIEAKHGELPQTPKTKTGGGGWHYLFKCPTGKMRNSASKIADGLDVRGEGGYIVAPPSRHASGKEYQWAIDPTSELAECPKWLRNGSTQKGKPSRIAEREPILEGKRNDTLISIGGRLRQKGLSEEDIEAVLQADNVKRCEPPLDSEEVSKIAESAATYEPGRNSGNAKQSSTGLTMEHQIGDLDLVLCFDGNGTSSTKTKGTLIAKRDGAVLMMDNLDLAKESNRKKFIKGVAEKSPPTEMEEFEEQLEKHMIEMAAELIEQSKRAAEATAGGEDEADPLDTTPGEVKYAALEVLKSESLFEQISADIDALGIAGEEQLVQILYIIMTSRLLERPLSAIVQGASSSGKSYSIETVAKLMPPESTVLAHDFTEQCFYYMEKGSLMHKAVIAGERLHDSNGRDGQAQNNSKAFREMVASGVLRKAVTVKRTEGGPKTKLIEQPGPIAYVESTTATAIHDEDATRLLQLVTDESAGQTQKIVDAMRQHAKGQTADETKKKGIIERHHTMQRLLKPLAVTIPFIDRISLPGNRIATRRTFAHVISMIKSVALLRQYQKAEKDSNGTAYIEADQEDYRITYQLMNPVMSRTYAPLDQKSIELLHVVMKKTQAEEGCETDAYKPFTNQDCRGWIGVSEATIRRRLSPLDWMGIVSVDKQDKPYHYQVQNPELAEYAEVGLPHPDRLAEETEI